MISRDLVISYHILQSIQNGLEENHEHKIAISSKVVAEALDTTQRAICYHLAELRDLGVVKTSVSVNQGGYGIRWRYTLADRGVEMLERVKGLLELLGIDPTPPETTRNQRKPEETR